MRSVALAAAAVALAWPARGDAAPYDVYSCRLADGAAAPAGGWTSFRSDAAFDVSDQCRDGTGLITQIAAPTVFRFEARVPRQTGFPYLEGASRVVLVRGRP